MSIGSTLQQKIVTARLIGLAFFALFLVFLLFPKNSLSQTLMYLPFLGVAGSHLYISVKAVCPKCKTKLPQERLGLGLAKNLHSCPHCQLDFDAETMPEK